MLEMISLPEQYIVLAKPGFEDGLPLIMKEIVTIPEHMNELYLPSQKFTTVVIS